MTNRTIYRVVAVLVVLSLNGCGNPNRLPTYKTTGTVTYQDGQPIEEGSLMFVAEGKPPGRAVIEAGKYEVGTYEQRDGAVAGTFQVSVVVSPPVDYDPDAGRSPVGAKQKYTRPETSGLSFEVKPDEDNVYDIELERGK